MIYNFGPVSTIKNQSIIVPNCNISITPELTLSWSSIKAGAVQNPMYEIFYTDGQWFFVIKKSCFIKVGDTYETNSTYEFSTALVGGGGKGGNGNGAPAVDPRQAGGSGGGGGAVKLYTDYLLTPGLIYQIQIGEGATTLVQGGNTTISESSDGSTFTQIYIANGGYSGKKASYANEGIAGQQYPRVLAGGNNGDNSTTIGTGGSNGTHNAAATNGLNGTLLFANNYFNTKWENKYYGSGGGGGSGGYHYKNAYNEDIVWLSESTNYGLGGLDSGGRGAGRQSINETTYPNSFYGNEQYGFFDDSYTWHSYTRLAAGDSTILPADILSHSGITNMGGGGGGGGSCNAVTAEIDSNNNVTRRTYKDITGSNGGDGVVIFQLIKK